jgi:2-oxoglutarate ferredoxin oxidoreductase subunit gamma
MINSSLVIRVSERKDIKIIEVNATDMANDLGNSRVANMILLGAFLEHTKIVSVESILESFKKVLSADKHHLLDINKQALIKGASLVQFQLT